jgi:uncharacterized membrane protein
MLVLAEKEQEHRHQKSQQEFELRADHQRITAKFSERGQWLGSGIVIVPCIVIGILAAYLACNQMEKALCYLFSAVAVLGIPKVLSIFIHPKNK